MEDEDDFMPNLASMLEVSLVEDPDTALSLPATEVAGEKQDNKDENAIRENGNDDSDPESPPKNTSTDVPYSSPGDPHNEGTKDSDSEPSQTTELSQKTEEVVPFPPASVLDTELVDFGQQQLTLSENLSTSIVSDEEMKMYKRVFSDLKKVTRMRLHCTVCDCHIGCTQDAAFNMAFHRALRVLVCKDCETFYETGDFPCGDDGSEMFCCWCGQGGQLFCCSNCPKVFCKNCIRHNLGRKALQIVIDSKDWMCYNCNARPLWEHRALCWGLSTFLKQQSVGSLKIPAEEAEKCPGFNANLCCKGKKPAYFRAGQPLRLLLPPLYTMVTSVDMESSKLKTLLTPGRSSFSSSSLVTTTASNISSPTTSTLTNTRCTIMNGEGPSNQSLNSSNLAVRAVDQESQVQRPVVMKPRTPQNHVLLAPTLVPFCSPSVPQKVRLVDVQTTPGSIVRFGSVMLSNTNAPVNKVYINQDTTANSVIYTMSGSNTGTVRPVGPSPAKFLVVSPNNEPPLLTPLSSGTKPSGQIHVVAPSVVTIPVTKQSQKEDTVHIDLSGENDDDIVEVFSNVQDSREVVKDFEWMIQSLRKIDRSSKILAFHVEILRRKFMSEVNKKGHNAKGVRHLASKFNHLLGKATGRLAAEQNSIKAGFRDWLTAQKSDKEKSSDAELPEKDPEPPLDLDITCESDHEDANECGEDLSDTDSYSEDPFSDTAILERKVQNPEFKPFHAHTVRDLLRDKYGSKILYEILTDLNSSDDKEKQNAQKGGGVVTPVQDVATQTHESKEFEEVEEESEKKEFKEVEKEKPEKKEFEEVEEEEEPEKKEFEEEKEEPEKKEFEEVEEEEPEKKEFEEEKEEPEKKEFEEEKEEPEKKEFEEMEEEEEPEKKASTDADKCGVTRPTGWSCAFTDFLACTISTPMSSGSSTPSNISESSSRGKSENTVQDDSEHIVNASDTEIVIKQEPEEPEPVAGPSGIKTDSEMNSRKRKHSVSPDAADKRKRDSSSPPIQVPYLQVKENDSEDPVPIVDLTASDIEKILKPCSVAIPRVNTTS
ncbi:transcriptional regulator ATRX [Periplaneta americana]|uniref:transcriptional regulator ATRX n=1 Tax=Periplaneta americana TaxID=6978 RepID=UPI0037E7144A